MSLVPSLSPVRGKLYSIPAANPFIETLARGILEQAKHDEDSVGFSLAEWLVFLPTRRACVELRQALLRLSAPACLQEDEAAHAVLLPRLVPLGDTEEGETEREAVSALQRRLLLAQLTEAWLDAKARREKENFDENKGKQTTHAPSASSAAFFASFAPSAPATISLARALERLQADFALEEATPKETLTPDIVPANCAVHWKEALEFLRIVIDAWPQMLEERGLHDPSVERVLALSRHAEKITARSDTRGDARGDAKHAAPVIVAGSTGSVKATARLMRAALEVSEGQVILAGCPVPQDASSRRALFGEGSEKKMEPTHPLHPFRALFASWNMTQEEAANLLEPYPAALPPSPSQRSRTTLLSHAFSPRPTPLKREQPESLTPLELTLLPCQEAQEEADLIALILREALEEKGQRAALITRDRTLARRVRSALKGRWNLAIEDTAQQPLGESRAAQLFLLTLKALAPENSAAAHDATASDSLDITALKALFARAGGEVAFAWQNFEGNTLRKPDRFDPTKTQRAAASLQALRALLEHNHNHNHNHAIRDKETTLLVQALATLAPLAELLSDETRPARADLLRCHRQCAENFAALCNAPHDDSATAPPLELPPLYGDKGGRELKRFCDTLEEHWRENTQKSEQKGSEQKETSPKESLQGESAQKYTQEYTQDYLLTLEALLAAETRGGEYATHPRLAILGALEARLLAFDLLVLGGMTEGSWPGEPDKSPFLPESLRAKVGLKPLEHNIGLSALDFLNFASASKKVVATYAARHNGQPQQPSRFLRRLQACHPCRDATREKTLRAWLARLQHGEQEAGQEQQRASTTLARTLAHAPAPKAPQTARPLRVSLTSLATLDEDPYSLYARQVLRLAPLEALRPKDEPALYGSCLHACFEEILQTFTHNGGETTTELLEISVAKQLARFAPSRFAQAFWREPLLRSAERLLGRVRRLNPRRLWCEVQGEHRIALENGRSLTLSARADLIVEAQDGSWWLIDHKTGALPSRKSLENYEQPQLVLGAWLLQQGAFKADGITLQPTTPPAILPTILPQSCYWRFSGRRADNRELVIDDKIWAGKGGKKDDDKTAEEKTKKEGFTAQTFADECFARYASLLQHFDREATPYPARALSLQRAQYDPYRHLARRRAWADAD